MKIILLIHCAMAADLALALRLHWLLSHVHFNRAAHPSQEPSTLAKFFPPMTLPLFKTVDPGQLLPKSNTPLSFSPKEQNVVLWNTVVDRGSVYKIVSRGLRNIILTFDLYKIVYPPSLRKVNHCDNNSV